MTPVDVRQALVEALKLDLVGPQNGADLEGEILPQAPSRWYLTGFLVPLDASEAQRTDETAQDDLDTAAGDADATDDDVTPEPPAARRAFFPSSLGLSLLGAAPGSDVVFGERSALEGFGGGGPRGLRRGQTWFLVNARRWRALAGEDQVSCNQGGIPNKIPF